MKILNLDLTSLENSELKYQINKYPDGQRDITILSYVLGGIEVTNLNNLFNSFSINIKSRFNNFEDLNLIITATQALRGLKIQDIYLYIPYLLAARSDRKFIQGGTSYLVDIIAPILNAQNYKSITVYDIHSDVASACIKNLVNIDNTDLVHFVMNYLYPETSVQDKAIFISPDGGSLKKIYKLSDKIGYKGEIITCSKSRDENGKLSKTRVPMGNLWNGDKDIIIIDDICDGGNTFINISKEFKDNGYKGRIYLIVTHGIFSKGFKELSNYFDGIYCTNSYSDIPKWIDEGGTIITANNYTNDFIKQLMVF